MQCLDFLHWKRLKWVLLWGVILFLIITYFTNFWSLHFIQEIKDGKSSYKLKAKIHLGVNGNPTESQVPKFGEIVEAPESFPIVEKEKDHASEKAWPDLLPQTNDSISLSTNQTKPPQHIQSTTLKPFTRGTTPQPKPSVHLSQNTKKVSVKSHGTTYTPKHVPVLPEKPGKMLVSQEQITQVHTKGADCAELFHGDNLALKKAMQYQDTNPKKPIGDKAVYDMAQNCPTFIKERQYIMSPVSEEEAEFPIAFSILLFKETEMVERLLRAIYRPQNYYCLHVDIKSSKEVRAAIEAVANCFPNVFLSSKSVDVQWGWYSVLEPELICMEDLWKYPKWKYFINLTGQEFPLKTNLDMVRILKAYKGANNMEQTVKRRNTERTQFIHEGYYGTPKVKEPCPVNITLAKGSVHITVQRGFVDFILHDPKALVFKEWVKNTGVPDETFFSSLNVSPQLGVPGSFTGTPETNKDTNPFITRFKNWGTWPFDWPCKGQRVRMVCIFSIGDLPQLANRPELFANKFYLDYHPLAYDCMEELLFNRTQEEVRGDRIFNVEYYKQLDFVKHHVGTSPT